MRSPHERVMAAVVYRLNRVTFRQLYFACDYQQEDTLHEFVRKYPRAVKLFLCEIIAGRRAGRTWEECQSP